MTGKYIYPQKWETTCDGADAAAKLFSRVWLSATP